MACSQDIGEAFFCLKLHPDSANQLLFLMDWDAKAQVLTAHNTSLTKLVVIRAKASIMGILKSPLLLSFCKSGLDLKDEMLESLSSSLVMLTKFYWDY